MKDNHLKFAKALHFGEAASVFAQDGRTLQLESTYHGDRDELWIIERDKDGKEVARHNTRFIATIEWLQS